MATHRWHDFPAPWFDALYLLPRSNTYGTEGGWETVYMGERYNELKTAQEQLEHAHKNCDDVNSKQYYGSLLWSLRMHLEMTCIGPKRNPPYADFITSWRDLGDISKVVVATRRWWYKKKHPKAEPACVWTLKFNDCDANGCITYNKDPPYVDSPPPPCAQQDSNGRLHNHWVCSVGVSQILLQDYIKVTASTFEPCADSHMTPPPMGVKKTYTNEECDIEIPQEWEAWLEEINEAYIRYMTVLQNAISSMSGKSHSITIFDPEKLSLHHNIVLDVFRKSDSGGKFGAFCDPVIGGMIMGRTNTHLVHESGEKCECAICKPY